MRFKNHRLLLVQLVGRMRRCQSKLRLRCCASAVASARGQRVWEVFALPTQRDRGQLAGRHSVDYRLARQRESKETSEWARFSAGQLAAHDAPDDSSYDAD